MEQLLLGGGITIPMQTIVCITYGADVINVIHINTTSNELVVSEWTTRYEYNFINEANRLQQAFLYYLNRKGIPRLEDRS